MSLTEEDRHVLTLMAALVFGIVVGLPLGILIGKDWMR